MKVQEGVLTRVAGIIQDSGLNFHESFINLGIPRCIYTIPHTKTSADFQTLLEDTSNIHQENFLNFRKIFSARSYFT